MDICSVANLSVFQLRLTFLPLRINGPNFKDNSKRMLKMYKTPDLNPSPRIIQIPAWRNYNSANLHLNIHQSLKCSIWILKVSANVRFRATLTMKVKSTYKLGRGAGACLCQSLSATSCNFIFTSNNPRSLLKHGDFDIPKTLSICMMGLCTVTRQLLTYASE